MLLCLFCSCCDRWSVLLFLSPCDSMQITLYSSQSLQVHISIQFSWKATLLTRSLHQFTKRSPGQVYLLPPALTQCLVNMRLEQIQLWAAYQAGGAEGKSNTSERGLSLPSKGTANLPISVAPSLWTFTHLTPKARHIFFYLYLRLCSMHVSQSQRFLIGLIWLVI